MIRQKSGLTGRYEVQYENGETVQISTKIQDVVRWETNKGRSAIAGQAATTILEVVFYALRREGLTEVRLFDQWIPTVAELATILDPNDLGASEVDADEDPTNRAGE